MTNIVVYFFFFLYAFFLLLSRLKTRPQARVERAAVCLKQPCDVADTVLFEAEHDALNTQGDLGSLICVGLPAQFLKVTPRSLVSPGEGAWLHGCISNL